MGILNFFSTRKTATYKIRQCQFNNLLLRRLRDFRSKKDMGGNSGIRNEEFRLETWNLKPRPYRQWLTAKQKREQDSSRSRMDKNFGLYKYHSFTTFTFRTVPSVRVTRRMYRPDGMLDVLTVVCGDGRDARPCVSTETGRPNMSNISTRAIFALPSVTVTCRYMA